MRSLPRTPLAQLLWLVCIASVLVMIAGYTTAGLAVMIVALVAATLLRLARLR
jgi:hypothetical protein